MIQVQSRPPDGPSVATGKGASTATPTMQAASHDFETAIRLARDAFLKMNALKEGELMTLRSEVALKDTEIKELSQRVSQLEAQLLGADKRIAEMSKVVHRLHSFKQQVFESFVEDDSMMNDLVNKTGNISAVERRSPTDNPFDRTPNRYPDDSMITSIHNINPSLSNPDRRRDMLSTQRCSPSRSINVSFNETRPLSSLPGGSHHQPSTRIGGAVGNESPIHSLNMARHTPAKAIIGFDSTTSSKDSLAAVSSESRMPSSYANGGGPRGQENYETPSKPASSNTVDAREFFRLARKTLSYDEFTQLLTQVKAYNAREQSRQKTFDGVRKIMNPKYPSLFEEFVDILTGNSSRKRN